MPARESPDQPRVDGAAEQFAAFGLRASARNVFQQPGDLRPGEISVRDESGLLAKGAVKTLPANPLAERGRAEALPDDGVMNRLPGPAVPKHNRLTLIGEADGGDIPRNTLRLAQHLLADGHL